MNMKVINRSELAEKVAELRANKKKIVFTNGCFDILHAGHVRYLQSARNLGDVLIVGLNSDTSVAALKGSSRPINPQGDRAEVLAGLYAVDHIVIFTETTAENLIKIIKPEIYAKGGDYVVEELPEANVVQESGGKLVLIPEVQGRSSTSIIEKITSHFKG